MSISISLKRIWTESTKKHLPTWPPSLNELDQAIIYLQFRFQADLRPSSSYYFLAKLCNVLGDTSVGKLKQKFLVKT